MKKYKEKRKSLFRKKTDFNKDFEFGNEGLDLIRQAWNNLPKDISTDERVMFIEIVEKALTAYNKVKSRYLEQRKKEIN